MRVDHTCYVRRGFKSGHTAAGSAHIIPIRLDRLEKSH